MRTGTGTIYIGNLVCMSCETSHQRLVCPPIGFPYRSVFP